MIVEGEDKKALRSGTTGLVTRLARALNRVFHRAGKVWDDRYHRRDLTTPREVRNALVYVLMNFKKHGHAAKDERVIDGLSSATRFDGWRGSPLLADDTEPWPRPETWLMRVGWKRHGLIDFRASPRMVAARPLGSFSSTRAPRA